MLKRILISGILAAGMLSFSSCVKDLNTLPLNPTDYVAEVAYGTDQANYLSGLAKLYHPLFDCYGTEGIQNGSNASFLSASWYIGECTTDACKLAWSAEVWTPLLNYNTWSSVSFDQTLGTYSNSLIGATYVNEYLIQTSDEKLNARGVDDALKAKIHSYRAEARMLRAYYYWTLVDLFGKISFADENHPIGKEPPVEKSRKEAFDWLVAELEELVASPDMPEAASNYPRVDKGTALGLLIRLYLNAEVYTGTAMWKETKETCERLFNLKKYDLCPEYSWLFCGDNGENPEAIKEIMFGNFQDENHTSWNWGGTTMILASCADKDMVEDGHPTGMTDYWGGIRMPYEYVDKFFNPTNVNYTTGEYTIEDKRGQMFYIKGRQEVMDDIWNFKQGWAVVKYTNVPHNMTAAEYEKTLAWDPWGNADYVFMRLGEMYLAYAEACLELGQKSAALPYLNALRHRAGYTDENLTDYDFNFLFEEYSREMYWEGNRRRDLIRWDMFSSGNYMWKYKGGNYDGQSFSKHLEVFAIPTQALQANPNLKQNEGY